MNRTYGDGVLRSIEQKRANKITAADDTTYWISARSCDELISRPYSLKEAEKLKKRGDVEVIDIYKINTDKNGRVSFTRLDSLEQL